MKKIVVFLQIDYGAEEYLWTSPFSEIGGILKWWLKKETVDVYKQSIFDILENSDIVPVDYSAGIDVYDKSKYPIKIMLENNHCSYLSYAGKLYFHRGCLGSIENDRK